jgi:hypothetical protein
MKDREGFKRFAKYAFSRAVNEIHRYNYMHELIRSGDNDIAQFLIECHIKYLNKVADEGGSVTFINGKD